MPKEFNGGSLNLEARMLLHRTRDVLFRCEDRVVGEFGLTAEQYTVLTAMKHLNAPIRPTDVSRWVDHKVHTVSMIVDRMVRAGLLERIRDLPDRREVRLVITSKGGESSATGNCGSIEAHRRDPVAAIT
jgi:DNA-binding MarR family transcriptional regulator